MTANMKKIVAGVIAVAVAAIVFLTTANTSHREKAHNTLVASSTAPEQVAFFELIQAEFPDEYNALLDDMGELPNTGDRQTDEAAGFALGGQFTQGLRRDNAHYLATAPLEELRALNQAALTTLETMQDDPAACGAYAILGGAGLSMEQVQAVGVGELTRGSVATFRAIVAGRDTPVDHPQGTNGDIVQSVSIWQSRDDVTPDMILALSSGDPAHPQQCAAQTSFQRFIIENTDPVVERAMIRLVMLANGI